MKNDPTLIDKLTRICEKYGYDFRAWPSTTDPDFLHPNIYLKETGNEFMPEVYIRMDGEYEISSISIATTSYGSVDYTTAKMIHVGLKQAANMAEEIMLCIK